MNTLTPRQRQVLELRSKGKGYREIAADLGCSTSAVKHHTQFAYARLRVSCAAEAYRVLGWLVIPEDEA